MKLDMANALHRMRHSFLFKVISKFGFNPSFINYISSFISAPWIATSLVNGHPTSFFQGSRDLRKSFPNILYFIYYYG